ncbi:MAG: cytochrome c biogenesis protein CcdA [Gammaproteobacteria bacterium]|nr:cytochrome c biogenesis protein CcdA [Gammaproteobacteria bacterium]NIR84327.1 cytochrome c biogenesis protein CcdA [Gammaproteobacteria bacterium]NIR89843.1 cytochrome c biogenesis protein CcdA [Gammaproteobacteria bacterium]NIU05710.1 cytochrome c biogenesis protein CcdA [Gammaproteobacteria bacterium]NIV52470.1 cytochrome c biogenesis protein CcdA [Gammaproteobacteria bacterium]
MAELASIGVVTAFVAGLISFLSPCVLPLVPAYVSYVAGQSVEDLRGQRGASARLTAFVLSLFFVLGFSTVFVAFGASATALGQLFLRYRYEANIIGGLLIIAFGLFLMGLLPLPRLQRDWRFHGTIKGGRPLGAYVMGLAFAFGWTPCIGPVLGAILTASAVSSLFSQGVALLAVYALGLAVPFLATALFTGVFLAHFKRLGRLGSRLQLAAGGVLLIMGLAMITGQLSRFAYWLLETFPGLGTLG